MSILRGLLVTICAAAATVVAAPTIHDSRPTVTLDDGKFIGTTANGTNSFLSIPFAQPPSVVDVN